MPNPRFAHMLASVGSRCLTASKLQLHVQHCCASTSTSGCDTSATTNLPGQQQQPVLRPLLLQQERISADGSVTMGVQQTQQQQQQQQQLTQPGADAQQPHRTLPGVPAAAPPAEPISRQALETLAGLIADSSSVTVLTGAGCSTESHIPDYRGPTGAYTTGFTPMTHQMFMRSAENRRRYWARSFAGWHEFAGVSANAAHEGLARLQQRGWCGTILTQNVDRLHHKAGSSSVLELHGTTHRVVCMQCGDRSCRHELQERLAALNPGLAERVAQLSADGMSSRGAWQRALRAGTAADARKVVAASRQAAEQVPLRRPDGDVELVDAGVGFFNLAPCTTCGAELLKPDVVFFGDSVPKLNVESALAAASSAGLLLVVGSSVMVWSAFRLVKAAKEAGATLAIVNVGPTRADDLLAVSDFKVEALAGEVMMLLANHPRLLLPRVSRPGL